MTETVAGRGARRRAAGWTPGRSTALRSVQQFAAVLIAAFASTVASAQQPPPFAGAWSRQFETCSLSDDEDETRLRIRTDSFEDYRETCAMSAPELRADGSYRAGLSCPGRGGSGRGTLRVYMRSPRQAVFFTAIGKQLRSRDGVRCPAEPIGIEAADQLSAASEAIGLTRPSRSPTKEWLKLRAACASPTAPDRAEACAERRRLGTLLRSRGLCHYTRGNREGWSPCGQRGR